jgi:hypothetical protein
MSDGIHRWQVAKPLCVAQLLAGRTAAEKQDDPGDTDTEIKLGTTSRYSGPASSFRAYGKARVIFLNMLNDQGGINGQKVNDAAARDPAEQFRNRLDVIPPASTDAARWHALDTDRRVNLPRHRAWNGTSGDGSRSAVLSKHRRGDIRRVEWTDHSNGRLRRVVEGALLLVQPVRASDHAA